MKTEHICSLAFKNRHAQRLKLPAGSSKAVSYVIVPLVVEKLPVEVMVVGGDAIAGDRVLKFLQVVVSDLRWIYKSQKYKSDDSLTTIISIQANKGVE